MKQLLHVLYLEDDPGDAELVRDTLEAGGVVCHVTRVETRAAFTASLEQGGFDLILADYSLPSFDGLSALKIAQQQRAHVPFIFVSGTMGEEVAIEALKIGATDYVLKTRLSRLVPSVQRALREAQERTELSRAEEALRRNEAYLAEAQRLSHTGSFGWNVSSGEIYWSRETFRIFEYEPASRIAIEHVMQRVHPEDKPAVQQLIGRVSRERKEFDVEHRLLMPDGSVKYLRVVAHALEAARAGDLQFVGAVMDITERKRAELALEDLAGRLIQTQEEERSRVGRELHDHISQTLGVLTARIDQARADPALTPTGVAALEGLRQDAIDITVDVHRLSHRLHSSTLNYLGLAPALQKLVAEFSERHGISIEFAHVSLPAPLPSDVALCLFRVTEEGLTNIAKHSQARSARVGVHGAADGIHLTVEDDGVGFDVTCPTRKLGLGLVSMHERLRLLRGTVRVDSTPSRGTRIDAWVPATSLVVSTPIAAGQAEASTGE